jgi:hypothetical protein
MEYDPEVQDPRAPPKDGTPYLVGCVTLAALLLLIAMGVVAYVWNRH